LGLILGIRLVRNLRLGKGDKGGKEGNKSLERRVGIKRSITRKPFK